MQEGSVLLQTPLILLAVRYRNAHCQHPSSLRGITCQQLMACAALLQPGLLLLPLPSERGSCWAGDVCQLTRITELILGCTRLAAGGLFSASGVPQDVLQAIHINGIAWGYQQELLPENLSRHQHFYFFILSLFLWDHQEFFDCSWELKLCLLLWGGGGVDTSCCLFWPSCSSSAVTSQDYKSFPSGTLFTVGAGK